MFDAEDPNLYGYVFNDPVNFTDPTGLCLDVLCEPDPSKPWNMGGGGGGGFGGGVGAGAGAGIGAGVGAGIGAGIGACMSGSESGSGNDDQIKGGSRNNKRPSTKDKHQEGDRRRRQDQGGDKKRKHPSWIPRNP